MYFVFCQFAISWVIAKAGSVHSLGQFQHYFYLFINFFFLEDPPKIHP